MMRRGWFAVLLLVVAIAGPALGPRLGRNWAARARERQILRFAPSLDPDFARNVTSDSDPEWIAYCRRVGTGPLGAQLQVLRRSLMVEDFGEFRRRRALLEGASL